MAASHLLGERLHTLAALWRHPRASREQVARFQARKLRVLVEHAFERVPFQRRRMGAAGITPRDLRTPADLVRLPVTTKAEMRAQSLTDLVARGVDPERLILRYTTGSTGEPTCVRRTELGDHLLQLFRIRTMRLAGARVRDRVLNVASRGVPTERKPRSLARLPGLLGVLRSERIDCLQPAPDLAREVARRAPDVLTGDSAVITEIAALWPEVCGHAPGPRLVFVGGETATPAMRRRIERGFAAPVAVLYGSHEFNLIGWKSP